MLSNIKAVEQAIIYVDRYTVLSSILDCIFLPKRINWNAKRA